MKQRKKTGKTNLLVAFCKNFAREKEKTIILWKTPMPHCFKNVDMKKVRIFRKSNRKMGITSHFLKLGYMTLTNK